MPEAESYELLLRSTSKAKRRIAIGVEALTGSGPPGRWSAEQKARTVAVTRPPGRRIVDGGLHVFEEVQYGMSKKTPLQVFLSPQRLRELAGLKVYARGQEYYAGGNVQLHEHSWNEAVGEVTGSQPYRVELGLTPKGLVADCTCPAMSDYGFCKHAVALGLCLIDAPPAKAKTLKAREVAPDGFTGKYPNLAGWIKDGWIEIGRDGHSTSIIRVLDEGGLVWEGGTRHKSMDKILQEAEDAIADWIGNN